MKFKVLGGILAAAVFSALFWLAGNVVAQPEAQAPGEGQQARSEVSLTADVGSKISYQGVLRENGQPVNGQRNMIFRLYSTPICSTQVGGNIVKNNVPVAAGRFAVDLAVNHRHFDGQALWLEVEVAGTKIGCEEILPVPYALSLRPKAVVEDTGTSAVLNVFNQGNGWGLDAYSKGHDAVHGRSDAGNHAGVSGNNTGGGIGVYAYSDTGTAIRAAGTGVIRSAAKSYLWISGNGARPFHQADSTIIDLDSKGGAIIRRGPDAGRKNVMLPITVVAPLYGQDVTITDLDIFWKGQTEFDGITAVILRRQTGVGGHENIVFDVGGAGYACEESAHPDGCTLHYDTTSNNILTADSGILYITLTLAFNSDTSWVQIGGVRLTLAHD